MGKKLNVLVNYRNCLGLYHIAVEQMTVTHKNDFITISDFAQWIAEIYLQRGCDHVICFEFKKDKITKAGLKLLAECDKQFITDAIKDDFGQKGEFGKKEKEGE